MFVNYRIGQFQGIPSQNGRQQASRAAHAAARVDIRLIHI